jgi:hypothetical protein
MTGSEDLMRLKNWQIEALQKENSRLSLKLRLQEEQRERDKKQHEKDLENTEIRTRLLIQKEQILENLKHG